MWNALYVCVWASSLTWAVSKSMCAMLLNSTLSWLDVRVAFKDEVVASFALTIDSAKLDAKDGWGFQEMVFELVHKLTSAAGVDESILEVV